MAIKINNGQSSLRPKKTSKTTRKKTSSTKRVFKKPISLAVAHPLRSRVSRNHNSGGKFFGFLFKLVGVACLVVLSVFGFNYSKSYLYANENFFIDSIEINGCTNVTPSEIMQILPFQTGDSLLKVELCEAEKSLGKTKAELKNISMSRNWLDKKVVISLKERVPEVFISLEDKKMGLDFDNMPFDLRGNMSNMKIPVLTFSNNDERKSLLNFFHQVKGQINNLITEITEIKFGEVEDVVLTLNDKTNIYWGLPKENKIEEKSYKLQKILNDLSNKKCEIESIDLSFLDNNKNMIVVKKLVNEENKVNM